MYPHLNNVMYTYSWERVQLPDIGNFMPIMLFTCTVCFGEICGITLISIKTI